MFVKQSLKKGKNICLKIKYLKEKKEQISTTTSKIKHLNSEEKYKPYNISNNFKTFKKQKKKKKKKPK